MCALNPPLTTLSREGTKAHKQKYDLLVRFEASRPNEIWQADHKHLKIWLSNGKGRPKKREPEWPVCRIPERFYTDHCPDFESNRMEQVAADIRMRLDYSMVGEPRGRGKIKRFFETVNDMFLCQLDGFCPDG